MNVVIKMYKSKYEYRVVCNNCSSVIDLEEEDLILREIKDTPVNSYNCPVCKKRNYHFSTPFTIKLIEDFYNYRELHSGKDLLED